VGAGAFAFGVRDLIAVLVTSFSAFVVYTIVFEFHRGASARVSVVGESYARALLSLLSKNQRRYGGYVVHLGVVFMFMGVTMSSIYRVEELHTVKPGETFTIGPYSLRYDSVTDKSDDHMARMIANLTVFENGEEIAQIAPEKRFYRKPEQPATEVDFRTTLRDDLYVILGAVDEGKIATFQAYINPLVVWLWIGGLVIVAGTGICILPTRTVRQRERAREAAIARQHDPA
jgi:cytochrome c-type biogenesis protein CcmF